MASPVAVLGPAPAGRLVARLAARNGRSVVCWPAEPAAPPRRRRRPAPEPAAAPLAEDTLIRFTDSPRRAIEGAALVFLAWPAGDLEAAVAPLGPDLTPDRILVHAAKGLDPRTGRRPSEILAAEVPGRLIGALGGPMPLSEVLDGFAVGLVAASRFDAVNAAVAAALASPNVAVQPLHDLVGVELAGACAVALAPAVGLCDGLRLGSAARAVLLARGLADAARLGSAAGADPATFHGPAGLADLLVTTGDPDGLGVACGRRLAEGEPPERVLADLAPRTEALRTVEGLRRLAERLRTRLPTVDLLHDLLLRHRPPRDTLLAFLRRPAPASA